MKLPDFNWGKKKNEALPAEEPKKEEIPGDFEVGKKLEDIFSSGREAGNSLLMQLKKMAGSDDDSLEFDRQGEIINNDVNAEIDKIEAEAKQKIQKLDSSSGKQSKKSNAIAAGEKFAKLRQIQSESGGKNKDENLPELAKNLMEPHQKVIDYVKMMAAEFNNRENYLNGDNVNFLNETGKIEMAAFKGNPAYTDRADADLAEVARLEKIFEHDEAEKISENMEMFKTAIFGKIFGKGYVICRASKFDDYINKIDNIIYKEGDGKVIGAFDDAVRSTSKFNKESEDKFNEKKKKILKKNEKGGGYARYCLGRIDGRLAQAEQDNIPLFYLDLTYAELMAGLRDFNPSGVPQRAHKKAIDKFFSSMNEQMETLEGMGFNLSSFKKDFERIASEQKINIQSDTGYFVEYEDGKKISNKINDKSGR